MHEHGANDDGVAGDDSRHAQVSRHAARVEVYLGVPVAARKEKDSVKMEATRGSEKVRWIERGWFVRCASGIVDGHAFADVPCIPEDGLVI